MIDFLRNESFLNEGLDLKHLFSNNYLKQEIKNAPSESGRS